MPAKDDSFSLANPLLSRLPKEGLVDCFKGLSKVDSGCHEFIS